MGPTVDNSGRRLTKGPIGSHLAGPTSCPDFWEFPARSAYGSHPGSSFLGSCGLGFLYILGASRVPISSPDFGHALGTGLYLV